ncbi:MAG: porin [Bacteroidia bacterium]|nr:porin [Bacteroidia bacterium]
MKYLLSISLLIITFSVKAQFNYETVDKGLSFRSNDDRVKMKLSFRVQSLASFESDESGNNQEMKSMVRRMRLKSKGYIYNPKFEYKLELALSNRDQGISKDASRVSDGSKIVLDAVMKYNINKRHQIWFGQTKLPGNRERVISSMALQFVDRSNVNSKFNIDRDFGVQYRLKQKIANMPLTLAAAITTGEGRNITASNEENGLSYTGRIEFYPFGNFTSKGDYFSADLKREIKPKLAIGITSCYNENTNRSGGQLGEFVEINDSSIFNDITTLFVDAIYKYNGLSIMGEYANKNLSEAIAGYTSGTGYVGQLGYLFDNNYEIAARYTSVDLAKGKGDKLKTTEYTLGLSKYIVGHKLKVQTDISYITKENIADSNYRIRFQVEFGI